MNLLARGYFVFENIGEDVNIKGVSYKELFFSYNNHIYVFYSKELSSTNLSKVYESGRGYNMTFNIKVEYYEGHSRVLIIVEDIIDDVQKAFLKNHGRLYFDNKILRHLDEGYISITESSVYHTDENYSKKRVGINAGDKYSFRALNKIKESKIIEIENKIKRENDETIKNKLEEERKELIVKTTHVSIVKNPDFNYIFLHNSSVK